jgi:hypothetical protein
VNKIFSDAKSLEKSVPGPQHYKNPEEIQQTTKTHKFVTEKRISVFEGLSKSEAKKVGPTSYETLHKNEKRIIGFLKPTTHNSQFLNEVAHVSEKTPFSNHYNVEPGHKYLLPTI